MLMAPPSGNRCSSKKGVNKGAWTAEEDQKLAQAVETYGPRKWRLVADKAGLNRGGKSCRLRWMNYLRPNIKRGNISDQEEDLILRLHKLLGNRWSLIAGRLPGRTDNEIKNYWNSHLSKKIKRNEEQVGSSGSKELELETTKAMEMDGMVAKASEEEEGTSRGEDDQDSKCSFVDDDLLDFSTREGTGALLDLEWTKEFLELDETWFDFA